MRPTDRVSDGCGGMTFCFEFQFHGLESVGFGMVQMESFAKDVAPLL
jgi:hypothetical protein